MIDVPEQSVPVESPIYRQFLYDLAQQVNALLIEEKPVLTQKGVPFNPFSLTIASSADIISGSDIAPNNIFLPDNDGAAPLVGSIYWSQNRNPLFSSAFQLTHNFSTHTLSFNELISGGAGTATMKMVGGTRATLSWITTTSYAQVSTDASTLFIGSGAGVLQYSTAPNRLARGSSDECDLGGTDNGWRALFMKYTNTATVGDVTINDASGRVNIGAGNSSMVLTNNRSTVKTKCFCNLNGPQDATARGVQADTLTTGGVITITLDAACTNQVAIDFFLVNA